MALQLRDLCNEMPIHKVAQKYMVPRGSVQTLAQTCQGFSAGMIKFCEHMGWGYDIPTVGGSKLTKRQRDGGSARPLFGPPTSRGEGRPPLARKDYLCQESNCVRADSPHP